MEGLTALVDSVQLVILGIAESATTIIAASVPVLPALIREGRAVPPVGVDHVEEKVPLRRVSCGSAWGGYRIVNCEGLDGIGSEDVFWRGMTGSRWGYSARRVKDIGLNRGSVMGRLEYSDSGYRRFRCRASVLRDCLIRRSWMPASMS